jgi:hypothetical protein
MAIKYRKGYKYQLYKIYACHVDIYPLHDIITEYIELTVQGQLTIKNGYAWDGPSGPTIDTPNFMRGSLIHDALFQLFREGKLNMAWYPQANIELRKACLEDGMSKIRAWYVYRSVNRFAASSADPKNDRKILIAP